MSLKRMDMAEEEVVREPVEGEDISALEGREFIRLAFDEEGRDVFVNAMRYTGESWPPPETMDVGGLRWVRREYSKLPPNFSEYVTRGALYQFSEVL